MVDLTATIPHHIALLGDSIFDNAAYVPRGRDVITHLRALLADEARATLLAVDGAVIDDVSKQLQKVTSDVTDLVISVGGNDALGHMDLLERRARSSAEVLGWFAEARAAFEQRYARMLDAAGRTGIPTTLCTIYNGNLGIDLARTAATALSMFNDVIYRQASHHGLPVIELRDVCNDAADYANPIEPSDRGGRKIAAAIASRLV
jgi:hypothetical protein